MQQEPLRRVQDDLATMKAALGTGLPHDRSHAALYFLGAGFGALLVVLALSGLEAYARQALASYLALMLAAWAAQMRHLRSRRCEAPAAWRWGRKEVVACVAAMALLVGYVVWTAALGRGQGRWGLHEAMALASPLAFCLGAACVTWVAVDRPRWPNLGVAVALLVVGSLAPLCESRAQFYSLAGVSTLAGGVTSGLLLLWQLRRHEVAHAD
ncbi:MAG: hypothetical protein U0797_14475 [Gemmataceae bacterium]